MRLKCSCIDCRSSASCTKISTMFCLVSGRGNSESVNRRLVRNSRKLLTDFINIEKRLLYPLKQAPRPHCRSTFVEQTIQAECFIS